MMDESVQHRDHRLSSLDRRRDERCGAVHLSGTVWAPSVHPFDCVAQHGSPLWASPDAPLTGRAPPRAETGHIALLTAIRRIVAAIRLRRGRSRSRQQLRELDDHLLKDIGLKREAAGHEFPKPLWHWD
jgi:uncharacterized protein YjiS (DUF1127 family)